MRVLVIAVAAVAALCASAYSEASAAVQVRISLSSQRMNVSVDGASYATWAISTGRQGYGTPAGTYRPQSLRPFHRSSRYNWAPMPHSIFFYHGYAIHGTNEVRNLGRPASHGCIRLSPGNARTLYGLVSKHGMNNTRITITH